LLFLLLLAGALAIASWPLGSLASAPPLVITFLDVGQGDCIWVRTPGGPDILVDGGPEAAGAGVVAYLQSRGCTDIEYVLLTHPHADHVGGLIPVLQSMPTGHLWYNGEPYTTSTYLRFLDVVGSQAIPTTILTAGLTYTIGSVELAVLHPTTLVSKTNDNSIVCLLSYGTVDVMLTGDVEEGAESQILSSGYRLEAEILKVAHHGSNSSSSAGFLQAVSPEVAVISVGAGNRYGHPSPHVLGRLGALPAQVYRTDLHGTVIVTTDGNSYQIRLPAILRYLYLPFVVRP
jgi:competence protein ComEC